MSVLTDVKMKLLRYNTKQYILENSTSISFVRKTRVRVSGGGYENLPSTLPPQIFRFINQTTSGVPNYASSDDGEVRTTSYVLLGLYDADVDVHDSWNADGIDYEVDGIIANNEYETRIAVTAFAKEPVHG